MSKLKIHAVVLVLALMTPVAAAASPACMGCQVGCQAAYPGDEEQFLNCFAGCYDEYGFACQRQA